VQRHSEHMGGTGAAIGEGCRYLLARPSSLWMNKRGRQSTPGHAGRFFPVGDIV
jgi:hypothetical protein